MKKSMYSLFLVFIFSSTLLAQSKLNKSYTGIKKIKMNTASGDCKLIKGSGTTVSVDLQHTFGDEYQPEISQEEDRLIIREKFNSNSSSGNAQWTITIPDGVEVNFSTGSGELEASNLSVDLDINTGSGDILLSQTKGDIHGNTGSGNVEVDNFSGEIKANTGSGNIVISKSKGELNLNCGSGDIRIDDSKALFSANTGSGSIVSRDITIEGSSSFNSGSGDAEVVLNATPKYNISVNSGSGDARLDFNGNTIEGEVVMKANKRNGVIKAPFEFDKTEEIERGHDQIIVRKTVVKGNSNVKISVGTGSGAAVISK